MLLAQWKRSKHWMCRHWPLNPFDQKPLFPSPVWLTANRAVWKQQHFLFCCLCFALQGHRRPGKTPHLTTRLRRIMLVPHRSALMGVCDLEHGSFVLFVWRCLFFLLHERWFLKDILILQHASSFVLKNSFANTFTFCFFFELGYSMLNCLCWQACTMDVLALHLWKMSVLGRLPAVFPSTSCWRDSLTSAQRIIVGPLSSVVKKLTGN